MRRLAALLPLLLAACTTSAEEDLAPVNDRAHPLTALADYVLADYMTGELHDGTTTCVAAEDGREAVALEFDEEAKLMARHISLSPFSSCGLVDGKWTYTDGGPESYAAAHVIEVHGLSCTDATNCTAFVRQSRGDVTAPDERYDMAFADGSWAFTAQGPMQ